MRHQGRKKEYRHTSCLWTGLLFFVKISYPRVSRALDHCPIILTCRAAHKFKKAEESPVMPVPHSILNGSDAATE